MRHRACAGLMLVAIACRSPQPHDAEATEAQSTVASVPDVAPIAVDDAQADPFFGIEALEPRAWAAWPLENVDIVGFDGWRIDATHGGFERDHGLVFASDPGAFVLAIADATVTVVERGDDDDVMLSLAHGDGIESHYGPLTDALVHVGLPIERGAAIGLASGSSLRLRVTVDGIDIDPLLILRQPLYQRSMRAMGVRLPARR